MTVAVLGDVHANLEALSAVLRVVDRAAPDRVVALGDLVGYNADPAPCVRAVLARAAVVVRGNHDKAAARLVGLSWFNPVAAEAVRWTRDALDPGTVAALAALRAGPVDAGDGMLLCHGSPSDEDEYLASTRAVEDAFRFLERSHPAARFCLHGHTHVPYAAAWRAGCVRELDPSEVALEGGARYLLNPGSVGQPRDGNPGASFGILDLSRGVWRVVRVPYDVDGARAKIAAARLPAGLAARLADGR